MGSFQQFVASHCTGGKRRCSEQVGFVGGDPKNPAGVLKKYDYALLLERLDEGIALMGVELDLPFRLLPSIAANPNTAVSV